MSSRLLTNVAKMFVAEKVQISLAQRLSVLPGRELFLEAMVPDVTHVEYVWQMNYSQYGRLVHHVIELALRLLIDGKTREAGLVCRCPQCLGTGK